MPSMPRIVLDPGHGGQHPLGGSTPYGTRGPSGSLEKEVTLRMAEAAARHLGGNVVLTRENDRAVALADRAALSKRYGAGIFISLHANGGAPGFRGTETYVHPHAQAHSAGMGESILARLARICGPNRGLHVAPLAVLRPDAHPQNARACLLEVDYLTDMQGERRLRSAQSLDAIGRAIADGVRDHLSSPLAYGTPLGLFERYQIAGRGPLAHPLGPVVPDYTATTREEALRLFIDWMNRGLRFAVGVPDTSFFPHSAICKLEVTFSGGAVMGGTGFYVASNRILTAAHVVFANASRGVITELRVTPGKNGDSLPFSDFTISDPSTNTVIYQTASNRYDGVNHDFDLAVIRTSDSNGAPNGEWFDIEEQVMNPASGIIVCGYAGGGVDSRRQHLDIDSIRQLLGETFTYGLQTRHGTSGSPVFYADNGRMVATGVHCDEFDAHENLGCRLTAEKLNWIRSI